MEAAENTKPSAGNEKEGGKTAIKGRKRPLLRRNNAAAIGVGEMRASQKSHESGDQASHMD
jgi:hypothetical protein